MGVILKERVDILLGFLKKITQSNMKNLSENIDERYIVGCDFCNETNGDYTTLETFKIHEDGTIEHLGGKKIKNK